MAGKQVAPAAGIAAVLGLLGLTWSCASGPQGPAAITLQSAAAATAHAKSFTVLLAGVEVTYQAPDRVQQVEHGQAANASGGSTTGTTSAPFAQTITKVFIGRQYSEADTPAGQQSMFSASTRCVGEQNVADYVLGILRVLATSRDIQASGDRFTFRLPKGAAVPFPITGTATVSAGFVASISVSPGSPGSSAFTIGFVNAAPPVTVPESSAPSNLSCSPASSSG